MDVTRNQRVGLLAIMVTALFAVGCQSTPATTSVRYDNVRFMDVWSTYIHCLSSEEIQPAILDSSKLREVSQSQALRSPLEHILPSKLKNMVTQPASRLAVDVHAMAAACSLHAGNLAMSVGEHDLARNQFKQILENQTHAEYSYYASQARVQLSRLELTLQAALR
ncbi:MAG: hypothetical protein R3B37_08390 [Nitrospira sp.]|nr:hypothetical protein [Nitrospira sp.]